MKLNLTVFMLFFAIITQAQNNPKWDDTTNKNWSSQFHEVEIPSTLDGEIQKAYIHFSESKMPNSLISVCKKTINFYEMEYFG